MKIIFIIFTLVWFGFIANSFADVISLKCAPEGMEFESVILIDLDKKLLSFGHKSQMQFASKYKIVNVTEEFVTAVEESVSTGSEILVLNRLNGEYLRAGIGNLCVDSSCSESKIQTFEYKGVCKSKLF